MHEIGPKHSLSYRQEILEPLFEFIRSMESCTLIGSASMGKTRLLDFMMRLDVQKHYFSNEQEPPWIVRVDCNRAHEKSVWAFYEVLLISLLQSCHRNPKAATLSDELHRREMELILKRDGLLGQRYFELAVTKLCSEMGVNLCLLLDEFDALYRELPAQTLNGLRAVRDANKYRLCYVLTLRQLPEQLRSPDECESFFELFSRSRLGLKPYTLQDSSVMLQQLEARRSHPIAPTAGDEIIRLSGGHPGLLQAIFQLMVEKRAREELPGDLDWISSQKDVIEECRKLWEGLSPLEQSGLLKFVIDRSLPEPAREILLLKGLICIGEEQETLFSPVFENYLLSII